MRRHPEYGRDVILKAEREAGVHDDIILSLAKEIVYTHHEKWDGTGYPQGLRGPDIPIPGRVMALVDVWDADPARGGSTSSRWRPPKPWPSSRRDAARTSIRPWSTPSSRSPTDARALAYTFVVPPSGAGSIRSTAPSFSSVRT